LPDEPARGARAGSFADLPMRYASLLLTAILALGAPLSPTAAARAQSTARAPGPAARAFVVVVNASNPITTMSRQDVARIFLKKTHGWPNGHFTLPVDLGEDSPVRAAFSLAILGKDVPSIQAYWQQQIFSGHDVPPLRRADDTEVLDFVRSNAEAIGYVRGNAGPMTGLRVLRVVE
jgi:ABC-type phosphate transport system substrate-binding protein